MTQDESFLYEHDEDPRTWLFDPRVAGHGSRGVQKVTAYILGPDALRINRKSLESSLDLAVYDFGEQLSDTEYDPVSIRRDVEQLLQDILAERYTITVKYPIGYPASSSLICTLTRKDIS